MRSTRILILGLLASVVSACQSNAVIPEQATLCPQERPQMCTMDYMPACGYKSATEFKTYSNACGACADTQVVAVQAGECPKN